MKSSRGPDGSPSDPDDLVGSSGSAPASKLQRDAARLVALLERLPAKLHLPSDDFIRRIAAGEDVSALVKATDWDVEIVELMLAEDAMEPRRALQMRNARIYQEVRADMPKPGRVAGKAYSRAGDAEIAHDA